MPEILRVRCLFSKKVAVEIANVGAVDAGIVDSRYSEVMSVAIR